MWQRSAVFGVAYFAGAWLSNFLSVKPSPFEIFWLPVGLYVGVLLLNGYRAWPALMS